MSDFYKDFRTSAMRLLCRAFMNHWYGDNEPGVAIGSTKSKFQIAAAVTCLIGGVPKAAITAQDYSFTTAEMTDLGNSEACKVLVIGKTGTTVETRQGPIVAAGTDEADVELPPVPDGYAPLGEIYIKTASDETFVFGTTLLDANDTNATYRDLVWPDTGQDALPTTGSEPLETAS